MADRAVTCRRCGAENPEDVRRCLTCDEPLGEPTAKADGVEIEVYELEPEPPPSSFERTLAAARAGLEKGEEPPPDLAADELIRRELADGYRIRRRRDRQRRNRPRNILIFVAAVAAVAAAVFVVVRVALNRWPAYNYARPAYDATTEAALGLAREMETTPSVVRVGTAEEAAALSVGGVGGGVFLDGNYVAAAPVEKLAVPPGVHHVVVKNGAAVTLDTVVELKPGERYRLEPAAATALYSGLGGTAGARR